MNKHKVIVTFFRITSKTPIKSLQNWTQRDLSNKHWLEELVLSEKKIEILSWETYVLCYLIYILLWIDMLTLGTALFRKSVVCFGLELGFVSGGPILQPNHVQRANLVEQHSHRRTLLRCCSFSFNFILSYKKT